MTDQIVSPLVFRNRLQLVQLKITQNRAIMSLTIGTDGADTDEIVIDILLLIALGTIFRMSGQLLKVV